MSKYILILHDAQDATTKGRELLKERLCQLFGADMESVTQLLATLPVILERGLDKAQAEQLKAAFVAAGAEIEIMDDFGPEGEDDFGAAAEPAAEAPPAVEEPAFEEPPVEEPAVQEPQAESYSPELSMEDALEDDEELEVVGYEAVKPAEEEYQTDTVIEVEEPAAGLSLSEPEEGEQANGAAVQSEELSALSNKLDELLGADPEEEVEEPADTLDLDAMDARIEDLKDMLDREIAGGDDLEVEDDDDLDLSLEPEEAPPEPEPEPEPALDMQLEAEGTEPEPAPAAAPAEPAAVSLAMDDLEEENELVGPPVEVDPDEAEAEAADAAAPVDSLREIAPDSAFAKADDAEDADIDEDYEEEWEYVDEDDDADDGDRELPPQPLSSGITRAKKLRIGAIASLLLLVIGGTAFLLRPDAGGRLKVDLDDPTTINSVLNENKRILEEPKAEEEAEVHPLHTWGATVRFKQSSFALMIRSRNEQIIDFDILSRSIKPKPLTPEQIVLGMRNPLWIKKLERKHMTSILHTVPAEPHAFSVIGIAPAFIQDEDDSGRVVTEVRISGMVDESAKELQAKLTVIGGYKPHENPKFSNIELTEENYFRLFFERDFKGSLQHVEKLEPKPAKAKAKKAKPGAQKN